jgi:diguanylate cyclase (GGDEF)-like protein/PAS domain S-box-containing protein
MERTESTETPGQDQHPMLRAMLESVADAVITTDSAGRVGLLNSMAAEMIGCSKSEAAGRPIEEILELRERRGEDCLANPAYEAIRQGLRIERTGNFLLVSRDRRRMAVELSATPIPGGSGEAVGCVVVLRDVSLARQLAERMSYQAHHDSLTGLPNRILLVDRLEQGAKMADRNSDRLAVMFLDLDGFQEINETHGSATGDELLREAASRLRSVLRESDTVCRLGGDEFVVMLPGVKLGEDIESVAAKLLAVVSKPFHVAGKTLHTSCSIGVSVYPQDGSDVGTLMRLADGAMYEAKRTGRNQYLFAKAKAEPVRTENLLDGSGLSSFITDPYDR